VLQFELKITYSAITVSTNFVTVENLLLWSIPIFYLHVGSCRNECIVLPCVYQKLLVTVLGYLTPLPTNTFGTPVTSWLSGNAARLL